MSDVTSLGTPPPVRAFRQRPGDAEKTVVVSGAPRGGTSFAAAIVAALGVPFDDGNGEMNPRLEVADTVSGWKRDRSRYEARVRYMNGRFAIWAIKHPRATDDLDAVAAYLRNPHFVFALKEPVSTALRTVSLQKRPDFSDDAVLRALTKILVRQRRIVAFCQSSPAPCLLLSYDAALRDLRRAVEGVAAFLGTGPVDLDAVIERTQRLWHAYFAYERAKKLRPPAE